MIVGVAEGVDVLIGICVTNGVGVGVTNGVFVNSISKLTFFLIKN